MKIEKTTWDASKYTRRNYNRCSPILNALRNMKVGDVLKIDHPEYACHYGEKGKVSGTNLCSLCASIYNLNVKLKPKKEGLWQYHLEKNILVVKKIALEENVNA